MHPRGCLKYLSDEKGMPNHSHRSVILNLACGPLITQEATRVEMLMG